MLACSTWRLYCLPPAALPPWPAAQPPLPHHHPPPRPLLLEVVRLRSALRLVAWPDHGAGPVSRAVVGRPYRDARQQLPRDHQPAMPSSAGGHLATWEQPTNQAPPDLGGALLLTPMRALTTNTAPVRTSSHEGRPPWRKGRGLDPFTSAQPATGPLLSSQPHAATNHPQQPLLAILATPMSAGGAWPEPMRRRRCPPSDWRGPPTCRTRLVLLGLKSTAVAVVPVVRSLDQRVYCPDQTWGVPGRWAKSARNRRVRS
jgi:hypothetical protein